MLQAKTISACFRQSDYLHSNGNMRNMRDFLGPGLALISPCVSNIKE